MHLNLSPAATLVVRAALLAERARATKALEAVNIKADDREYLAFKCNMLASIQADLDAAHSTAARAAVREVTKARRA